MALGDNRRGSREEVDFKCIWLEPKMSTALGIARERGD